MKLVLKMLFVLGAVVALAGCGAAAVSLSGKGDVSGEENAGRAGQSQAVTERVSSGWMAPCYNSYENGTSLRDVYQFKTDGEVAHEMWVFGSLDCPTNAVVSAVHIFGTTFKLKHQTVLSEINSQGLATSVMRLSSDFTLGGSLVETSSDSIYVRVYTDAQRMCFGVNEGHFREDDVSKLPDVFGKSSLATLYGGFSLSGAAERIDLTTYDHCLTQF